MKSIIVILVFLILGCDTNRNKSEFYKENYVSWEQAKKILLTENCNISAVSQGHNLQVNIMFKDNSYVSTKEPRIDAVFIFLSKSEQECGQIDRITE